MKNLLKFLLTIHLKRSHSLQSIQGFSLIELLVALILAFLVITPLMGFMISIMTTDKQEQAKASSEQEIQAALDYIARDLQQAIYIYDATALTTKSNTDPTKSGISDQIPPGSGTAGVCSSAKGVTCEPILVFWKRKFFKDAIAITSTKTDPKDSTFVYSLVGYYIIQDNSTTWSKATRIARFEISDGVQDPGGSSCGTDYPNDKYVKDYCPDNGFQRFNLNLPGAAGLQQKINSWTKASSKYTQTPVVLLDFIDQTPIGFSPKPTDPKIVALNTPSCPAGTSLVSGSFTGFYTCVSNDNTTAQVVIRGNALARLQNDNLNYSNSSIGAYFPTASVRVQGRGYLYSQ